MHGTPINSTALCAHGKIVGLGPDVCFLHHYWQEMVGKCSCSDTKEEEKMLVLKLTESAVEGTDLSKAGLI